MVVEGIHAEDIFELVSLVLPLIISWTFRILAHDLLSIAHKQIKTGPRSSVFFKFNHILLTQERLNLKGSQLNILENNLV